MLEYLQSAIVVMYSAYYKSNIMLDIKTEQFDPDVELIDYGYEGGWEELNDFDEGQQYYCIENIFPLNDLALGRINPNNEEHKKKIQEIIAEFVKHNEDKVEVV